MDWTSPSRLGYTAGMTPVLLDSPALDGYGQMALDEALLESASKDSLILRLYHWSGSAVTFGYFQAYAEILRHLNGHVTEHALVRRLTGGGLVYHDGDITFSLIFPWDRLTDASWVYKEVHRGVHLGLKARRLHSRLWSPPNVGGNFARGSYNSEREISAAAIQRLTASPTACFTGPSPMDLVHENGTKCLGGALRRRRGIGLYQGSMRPEGFGVSSDRLAAAVTDGIGQAWRADFHSEHLSARLLEEARGLAERKYMTENWNQRR